MDEIIASKPVAQLEDADSSVKTYVQLLEKKLKSSIAMNNLNKEIERKLFVTQEKLHSLIIQQKENCQNDDGKHQEDIIKLKVDNTMLDIENKQLKQHIIMLQNEIQQLKVYGTICKSRDIQQQQIPINSTSVANKDPNANSVLVKGFTENQLNTFLKINIIHLGRLMGLKVADKDIVKVTKMEQKFYERHNLKPNKIILIVQFKTPELKVEFLKNKEKLKTCDRFEGIEISDYVSDEVYNLYQYAKILKTCGYAQIYWRNNCVYAKKTRSTFCDPVAITTKADVDTLKNSNKIR